MMINRQVTICNNTHTLLTINIYLSNGFVFSSEYEPSAYCHILRIVRTVHNHEN